MRKTHIVVGVVVVALIGMACQPQGAATTTKTIVVAIAGDPPGGLDPSFTQNVGYGLSKNVYSYLVTHKVDFVKGTYLYADVICDLCESYQIAQDQSKITFKIRKGVTFSNGDPLTAEDIRWSWQRGWSVPAYTRTQLLAGGIKDPSQLRAVDDYTFEVSYPDGINRFALTNMVLPDQAIYDKKAVLAHTTPGDPWGQEFLKRNMVGSGPYVLTQWISGQQIVLEARSGYYGEPKPQIQKIIYRIVPNEQTRFELLKSGAADIDQDISPQTLNQVKNDSKVTISSVPAAQDVLVWRMNPTVAPFNDPHVRRAISYDIPTQTLIDQTLYGFGAANPDICGSTTFGYQPQTQYVFDPAKAKAELAQSKYPNGFSFTITISAEDTAKAAAMVFIQAELAKLGIQMQISQLPGVAYQDAIIKRQVGPVNVHSMGPWLNDCLYWVYWMFTSTSPTNHIAFNDPRIDALSLQGLATTDSTKYLKLLAEARAILVDQYVVVPLYLRDVNLAFRTGLSGIVYWPWVGGIEMKYVSTK